MDEEILAEMNRIIKEFGSTDLIKVGAYTPQNLKKKNLLKNLPTFLNKQNEKKPRFFISFKIDFRDKKSNYIILKDIKINETLGEGCAFLPKMKEFFLNREKEIIYFGKYISVRPEDEFDECSIEYFEILKSILQEKTENLIRKSDIRIPYFLLGGMLPIFEKNCLNYLKKDVYPEIQIKRDKKEIIICTDKLENWYPFGKNYMIYEDRDKDYKIIRSDYDISPLFILKDFTEKGKVKVPRLNFDLKKFIKIFENLVKITGIEEMKSDLYKPKNIETGIVFDIVDNMLVAVLEGVFDGKRKKDMEKDVFVDNLEIKKIVSKAEDVLIKKGFLYDDENDRFYMGSENRIYDFIVQNIKNYNEDFANFHLFYTPKFNKKNFLSGDIKLTFSKKKDFVFELESDVFSKSQISEIILAKKPLKKYYRLKNGDILKVKNTNLVKIQEMLFNISASDLEITAGKFTRSSYFEFFLNNYSIRENNCTDYFTFIPEVKIITKKYQKFGVNWMMNLKDKNMGGILADDMGLGKTLQALIFLKIQQKIYPQANQMVIVPKAALYNWENEIKKFFKDMKYRIITGRAHKRQKGISNILQGEIVITSYSLLMKDVELYKNFEFSTLILDEAQIIKNRSSIIFEIVNMLKRDSCFALTGAPIENNLMELWGVFETVLPGYLGTVSLFKQKYIVERKSELLRSFIKPFILRRIKGDVEKYISKGKEKNIILELEPKQKEIYDKAVAEYTKQIMENENIETTQILKFITKLRKICTYPEIGNGDYYEISAKEQALDGLLKTSVEKKHKVIIFSQFTSGLKKLEEKYSKKYKTLYLDGNTTTKKRMKVVEKFNMENKEIFFISLKAGGIGLNITGADIIIHYDPWWNLSLESQYIDRTHRIGQKKEASVYNFITEFTIEEYINKLKEKKDLSKDILDSSNFELLREELIRFFKINSL